LVGSGSFSSGLAGQGPDELAAGRRIIATASLAAKEYAIGVAEGAVVMPAEVKEAAAFLREARLAADDLPERVRARSITMIDRTRAAVDSVVEPSQVLALADSLEGLIRDAMPGVTVTLPASRPSARLGARVFAESCASCHGSAGRGDGPAAPALDPPPADLTDRAALGGQSPLDFYRKTLIGVTGTAMPGFEGRLSDDEVWAAAWYATLLRYDSVDIARGHTAIAALCADCNGRSSLPSLAVLPADLADPAFVAEESDETLALAVHRDRRTSLAADSVGETAVIAYLRTLPFAPEAPTGEDPVFARVRTEIARGLRAANEGDAEAAASRMFDSYVAFEAVETAIALRDNGLVSRLEVAFSDLRNRAAAGVTGRNLAEPYRDLDALLDSATTTLATHTSGTGLFAQSFILLLREGMEALLIVGALVALVMRGGAAERRREIRWGVGLAMVASLATAVLLETVFRISGAQREAMEGITMLAASLVLLIVSFWLISRIESSRWRAFVAEQGQRALREGSRFALASAAFLAVYREGFETILFYKALFISAGGGAPAVIAGAALAGLCLAAVYVAILRFGLRIPLRPFFGATSLVLLYMAFSFVGKGIAELQEGRIVSATFLDWAPRVPWMGIYPTVQTLVLQFAIVALVAGGLAWTFLVEPRRQRAG